MIEKLISGLGSFRGTIAFYVLMAACAGLYAWGATARAERDQLTAWAHTTCAAAGTAYDENARGAACAKRVLAIAELNRAASEASAKTLADAMSEQQKLSRADLQAAAKEIENAAAAAKKMERENAKIDGTDRVGGDWFRALNGLGGLREPSPR